MGKGVMSMEENNNIKIAFDSIEYLEEMDIVRAIKELESHMGEEEKKWYSIATTQELFEMLKMPYGSNKEMLNMLYEKSAVLPNSWTFLECIEWVELQSAYQVLQMLKKTNMFFLEEKDTLKQSLHSYYEKKYEEWLSLYRDRKSVEEEIKKFFEER